VHARVYQEFERVCSERGAGGKVLDVGAVPGPNSLLRMKALEGAAEKVGINLRGPHVLEDFTIVKGNANHMDCFPDEAFDVVLCNAMLEHDRYFWKAISEIRRVTRRGGLIVIGTPGYKRYGADKIGHHYLGKTPLVRRLRKRPYLNALFTATLTFRVHDAHGDYYRFSPQTFKEVFFEGCHDVRLRSVMLPPRIIGSGIKS
jgi:ubiquinone/menaquinone biosynthesis C-methylase UbiE